jgi:hypothetical protein
MNIFQHWLVSTFSGVNKAALETPERAAYMTEELPDTSKDCAVATNINPASACDWQWTRWDYGFEAIALLLLPVSIVICMFFGELLKSYALRLQKREKKKLPAYGKIIMALRDSLRSFMIGGALVWERDHFFIGAIQGTAVPMLIHKRLIQEHVHIVAPPGHGKSEKILAMLAQQHAGRGGSVVLITGKDDCESQVKLYKAIADATGLPFKVVTLDPRYRSYMCNPHEMTHWKMLNGTTRVNIEMIALGLDIPILSSQDYFSIMGEGYMRNAWRDHNPLSYREALDIILSPDYRKEIKFSDREIEHSSKVRGIYGRAADITIMEQTKDTVSEEIYRERVNFIPDVHEKPGIIVIVGGAILQSTAASLFNKHIAHDVVISRILTPKEKRVPLLLQLDDLKDFMDPSLELLFRQARSCGISVCFAHQTMSNLGDYQSAVTGNTKVRIYAGSADAEMIKYIGSIGGTKTEQLGNYSDDLMDPDSLRDVKVPRYGPEEILELSMKSGVALVDARPAEGLTRLRYPVPVEIPWPCPREVYDAICAMPWPGPEACTILAAEHKPPPPAPAPPTPPPPPQSEKARKMFRRLNQNQE